MSRKSTSFFLGKPSLISVFSGDSDLSSLRFTRCGPIASSEFLSFSAISDIPHLGVSPAGASVRDPMYLVTRPGAVVQPRTITHNDGGTRAILDQLKNPDSVVIAFGGDHESGALIAGSVGTATDSKVAMDIFESIQRAFKSVASKRKSFWIDSPALECARSGRRLTTDYRMSGDRDIILS